MNEHYDFSKAREYLGQIRKGFMKPAQASLPSLGDLNEKTADIWFETVQHPPSDRMMHAVDGQGEDLILTIQGVLSSSTLPPLPPNRRYSTAPTAVRHMRQYVQVTGLGLPEFDQAIEKVQQIQEAYQTFNPAYSVNDIQFTQYEGNQTLEAHARYFTDRYLLPNEKNIPFSRLVDPEDVLTKLQPDAFIHGPDNEVEYCKLVELGKDGAHRYTPCDPRTFKAGDIVEIAFTFIGIPAKNDRRYMLVNLKAVTLICDLFRKQAEKAAKTKRAESAISFERNNTKRRRLYVDMGAGLFSGPSVPEDCASTENTSNHRLRPKERNATTGSMEIDFFAPAS